MTISSSTDRDLFPGNGVTTVFPLSFRFLANADISAALIEDATGNETPLVLGTNYTLVGAGQPEVDGNPLSVLTMLVAPAIGYTLSVARVMEIVQPTDIVNQGRFYPEVHETVFDRLTMLIQQVAGGVFRALPLNLLGTKWDAQNKPIENLADGEAPADAVNLLQMQTYVGDHISVQTNFVNVRDYGAVGDGVTNDHGAFAAALAASDSVYVPPGKYLITGAELDIRQKRLWAKSGKSGGIWADRGTTGACIWITQTANSPFFFGNGTVVDGLQVHYPNQDGSTITDTSGYPAIVGNPIVYPPTFHSPFGGSNWKFKDCISLTAYEFISAGDPNFAVSGRACGRGEIIGCSAFVIKYFFRGYNLLDQVIIDDFTISPGVITGDDPAKQKLYRWALQNARAFQINKSDGLQIGKGLIYGVDLGFAMVGTLAHSLMKIRGVTLDGSRRFLDSPVTLSGCLISDCQILCNTIEAGKEPYTPAIWLRGPNAPAFGGIQMDNIQCHQCLGEVIKIEGTGTTVSSLTLTNFHFMGWGKGIGAPTNVASVLVNSSGSVLQASKGWLYPGAGATNLYGFAALGNGAARMMLDDIDQDGGLLFASLSTVPYIRIANCTTFNTLAGTADIALTSTTEVYEYRNRWAVPPTSKISSSPFFHARQSGTQTLASGATAQFVTEVSDTDSSYNAGTGVFTCKTPGQYQFTAQLVLDGGTVNDVWVVQIVTTLRTYQRVHVVTNATDDVTLPLSPLADMRVGDTAQVVVQRTAGSGSFTTASGANATWFSGKLLD